MTPPEIALLDKPWQLVVIGLLALAVVFIPLTLFWLRF
jgi:hypothetical protein